MALECEVHHIPRGYGVLKSMNSTSKRIILALLVVLALFVGLWAEAWPANFYSAFPGFGLHWVRTDGTYDEHLVRDVGGLYLGLGAASLAAIFARSASPGRTIGFGWTVFNVLHLGYHLLHLEGSTVDRVGNVATLSLVTALGLFLLVPPRTGVIVVASSSKVASK